MLVSEVRERGGTLWLGLTQVLADTRIARSLSGRVHRAAREALDAAAGGRFGKEHIGCTIVADVRLGLAPDGRVKATVVDVLQVRASPLQQAARTALQTLQAVGLLTLQRRLSLPTIVDTVAVICPPASAGQADVAYSLGRLFGPWSVEIRWLPSTFEGPGTEASIRASLDAAAYMASHNEIAAVLIVRGGGSPGSLAYLDSEPLARAVAAMRVPVITGIGHADDRVLLDEVAWHVAATPTDAAQHVIRLRAATEKPAAPPACTSAVPRTAPATVAVAQPAGIVAEPAKPFVEPVAVTSRSAVTIANRAVPIIVVPAVARAPSPSASCRHPVRRLGDGTGIESAIAARGAEMMTIAFPDGDLTVQAAALAV